MHLIKTGNDSGCKSESGSLEAWENFTYSNSKMGCILKRTLQQVKFYGVSVRMQRLHLECLKLCEVLLFYRVLWSLTLMVLVCTMWSQFYSIPKVPDTYKGLVCVCACVVCVCVCVCVVCVHSVYVCAQCIG